MNSGDHIEFMPGLPGKDAEVTTGEILPPFEKKWIFWNGRREDFLPRVYFNNQVLNIDDKIQDGYKLTYISNDNLQNLLEQKKTLFKEPISAPVTLTIKANGEVLKIVLERQLLVNVCLIVEICPIRDGDSIEV
ncbi:ATPase, partial [Clostridium butyricum]|nr:ATPase [Clostridium butyricum]